MVSPTYGLATGQKKGLNWSKIYGGWDYFCCGRVRLCWYQQSEYPKSGNNPDRVFFWFTGYNTNKKMVVGSHWRGALVTMGQKQEHSWLQT